jgi:hypothetical protein
MIAHFIAHLIAQEKNPIAALRHLLQDPTIALIKPKIPISFTRTQVLVSKDRKHKCDSRVLVCKDREQQCTVMKKWCGIVGE